jgi:hypothetical protein
MQRIVLPALLLLLAGAVTAAPAPFAKPERRSALEQFRGEWEVAVERGLVIHTTGRGTGLREVWGSRAGHTVTITPDRLVWRLPDQPPRGDAVRAGKRGFDLTDSRTGQTRRGSFRREGDTLTLTLTEQDGAFVKAFVLRRKR